MSNFPYPLLISRLLPSGPETDAQIRDVGLVEKSIAEAPVAGHACLFMCVCVSKVSVLAEQVLECMRVCVGMEGCLSILFLQGMSLVFVDGMYVAELRPSEARKRLAEVCMCLCANVHIFVCEHICLSV